MKYIEYTIARDLSWKILAKLECKDLPIKISSLIKQLDIKLLSYEKSSHLLKSLNLYTHSKTTDGFTTCVSGIYIIFYNHENSNARNRFTIAHELGHILLGHLKTTGYTVINREPTSADNSMEQQANVFASRLLAPVCVLYGLNLTTAHQVSNICDISLQSAEYRISRLNLLINRNKFFGSPLEREVYELFSNYIRMHKINPYQLR